MREERVHLTPQALWEAVSAFTLPRRRTVLVAHNLAYDLRISQAIRLLPALGWELRFIALNEYGCWADWIRNGATLLMVDSASHLAAPVDDLARDVRDERPTLPDDDAPLEDFLDRCMHDARVIETACLRLWDWQQQNEMGAWRVTGPAQSWAAYRHRFMPERSILCHDKEDALEAEKRAAWTGRCEVWRHGVVEEDLFEWDFRLCYAHVAAHNPLPARLARRVTSRHAACREGPTRGYALLARCTVRQSLPVAPAEHDGIIVWPVGEFESVLWDCEIAAVRESGGTVQVHEGWLYRKAPVMRDWGRWITGALDSDHPEEDPIVRRALKSWARWTIGRFSLRYPVWQDDGRMEGVDLHFCRTVDHATKAAGNMLVIGGAVRTQGEEQLAPDASPAITSWVMAKARCDLWAAMAIAGHDNIVYMDTDSIVVTRTGHRRLLKHSPETFDAPLRVKRSYRGGVIRAPRNLELGETRRIAGLPRKAVPVGGSNYRTERWEGLAASLGRGEASRVGVRDVTVSLPGLDRKRVHLDGGHTRPIRLDVAAGVGALLEI